MNFEGLKHLATSWGGALANDIILNTVRGATGKAAESGGEILARRILEMDRDKVSKFLRDDLWKKGDDYQKAAESLLDGQRLRQQKAPRPYGNRKRFRPGSEDKYMFALARFYRLFSSPEPQPPQPTSGGGQQQQGGGQQRRQGGGVNPQVFQTLWDKYQEDLKKWKEDRPERAAERLDFFKELGLMDPEDLEAYFEAVHDDKFQQWFALPFFEMTEAAKASLKAAKKVGEKTKLATKTGWRTVGDVAEATTRPIDTLSNRLERRARRKGRI